MRTNDTQKSVSRITGRALLLAALLAMVFSVNAGSAQSSAAPKSTPGANPAALAKPAATPAKETAAPGEKEKTAKGPHEGIVVHGHWTIVVKNRDGSADKQVEFENSLVTTNLANMAAGPAFLFALLSGNGSFAAPAGGVAGGWAINLQAQSGSTPPCAFTGALGAGYADTVNAQLLPSCFITSVPNYCEPSAGGASPADCNQGLQVSMTTSGGTSDQGISYLTPSGFTLSGTIPASQAGGSIGTVETFVFINGLAGGGFTGYAPILAPFQFTSHPITSLPVTQGQSVLVTVSFSFS
jgi:hypothetical protein